MQPPDLRYIAKSTILKYLVCSSDISRDHLVMLEYFESFGQGVFGDEILSQIIEDFPGELTDELLLVLSPPHLRHLKLTRCSRLSCSGLQKAIAKCQQLQALDFSECIHLLHPTVFCCLKDKAFNLVSLSLENSQVVSDDIVQVALMCCPGLKHLNLSSCRNITDTAFALSNSELSSASSTATTNSPSYKNPSNPGSNITSVDISGCQSLSTTTVKYLVGLCGAKLKSINLAWTGVDCTALLYLAGLNMEEVARLVHETDHTSANLAKKAIKHACSSSMGSPMHIPSIKDSNLTQLQNQNSAACGEENDHELQNEFFWSESFQNLTQDSNIVSQTYLFPARPPEVFAEDLHDCDESLLNEIELLRLKDVIPVTYMSSLEVEHCQQFNESSDEESDDSFKTASEEFDLITYSLSEELETSIPISEERNASHEESLETQESFNTHHDKCGDSGVLKYAGTRDLCWNVPAGNHSTSNLLDIDSCKDVCASSDDTLLSCAQGESSRELENVTCIRNPAVILLSGEQSQEGFAEEIYEDCFDIESHPVMSCKEDQCFYQSSVRTCSLESSTCDDAVMSYIAVNENEPNCPIIPCEKAEEEEVKCDKSGYPIMPCAKVNQAESEWQNMPCENVIDMESEYPIEPCAKMNLKECDYPVMLSEKVMDDKVQCKSLGIQCMVEGVEQDCPVTLDVKSTGNGQRYPNMSCTDNEGQKASTHTVKSHSHEKREGYKHTIKPCWEDTGFVIPKATSEKETDRKSSELSFECSLTETKRSRSSDCMSSHSRVLQVADLLQTQMYQPQITSLDITDICYQNKPLGEACLKVFSKACNHLKNLTVSWTGLDDKMLTYLLRNERELESLSLVDCENLSNISVSTIPVYCPKLSSFDLKGMCYVTDHGVMPLTRSNDLKTVCLAEAAITDSTLESIAKGCGGKLSVLDISWCEDITDRGMSIIANSCPSLQHLGLRQCAASHLTLNALVAKCHLISSLNIAGVESLTDTALSSMAENMPLLREIDASWNSSLSDIGISALLECCTRLNKAVLCGLKRITSQPFLAIIGDLGRWYLLEQLCKYNRRSPSSVSEGKLALKVCDSETAKSLGDQIPCRSMAYAPSLRQVLLEYSDKVNDDHLSAIVAVCRGTLFIKDYYRQPVEPKWIFRS